MSPRWTIAKKELTGTIKERTILLAVVIQVVVAGFSGFLVVGLSALVDPDALPLVATPVVAVNGTTPLDDYIDAAGLAKEYFPTDEAARDAFRRGEVDAVILYERGADLPATVTLVLPDGDLRATLILVKVKSALEKHERDLREASTERLAAEPLHVESDARGGSYSFVVSLLVPLLVLLPVILAGALVADSMTEEVQRGTLGLLLASPARPSDVVEGKLAANVAVVPLLGAAWFALLALNGIHVPLLGMVLILLLATSAAFVMGALACAIAIWTRDRNRTHVVYALAFFLVLALSMVLPTSPVNAIARYAAGSADATAHLVVAGTTAFAVAAWLVLRVLLRFVGPKMAAGA